ncbi:MAG: IS21-like element helper ATPase IstB [Deltaproteobacteria bacterium]|nr:IS21-like element helper ATPase IstB [Deltaproteobacteria bacterium]
MNLDHQLKEQLKALKLSGFLQTLDLRLQEAQKTSLGYLDFFQLLLQDEIERREAKKLNLRLTKASFEEEKTLEDFDFSFNAKLNAKLIRDLGNCVFIEKREHVLLYGSAGVGKTHLAQALGHQACRLGYDVLFTKAVKLFRFLLAGRADHSWEKRMKKYLAPDLLIIDDFGLSALNPLQTEDFYEIVTERHLKSSIVITSNRPPQDWIPLFPDPVMANSALDRLAHHAHHIIMEGDSYRRKLSPKISTPLPGKGGN